LDEYDDWVWFEGLPSESIRSSERGCELNRLLAWQADLIGEWHRARVLQQVCKLCESRRRIAFTVHAD
jgi:hypothetical protein